MKKYRKIDLFFNGLYVCTTQQSKTCKEARQKYLDNIEARKHSFPGIGLVDSRLLKNQHLLKARFQK